MTLKQISIEILKTIGFSNWLSMQTPISPATDQQQKPEITFLIEEYKNIAGTHDRLRDELGRLFNYFLLLSAFPFTVAGIMFRQGELNLLSAPTELYVLFLIVGVGHLFLTLTIVDARHGQYRYARSVNLIRKYFADQAPALVPYLYLPTSAEFPAYNKLGHIRYQIWFMNLVGTVFVGYGIFGIVPRATASWGATLAAILYLLLYKVLRGKIRDRFQNN
jgi:hypothetical protein